MSNSRGPIESVVSFKSKDLGLTGPVGARGPVGPTGPIGTKGLTGSAGAVGSIGARGPIGPAGIKGAAGVKGPGGGAKGDKGTNGTNGIKGDKGDVGVSGSFNSDYLFWKSGKWAVGSNNVNIGSSSIAANNGVSIGSNSTSNNGVSIGYGSKSSQYSVSIGANSNADLNNTLVLNASGDSLNAPSSNSFCVKPIRSISNGADGDKILCYDDVTGEIFYKPNILTSNLNINSYDIVGLEGGKTLKGINETQLAQTSIINNTISKTQNISVSSTSTTFGGNVIATKFTLPSGTGFLKADGNVDNNNYALDSGSLTLNLTTLQDKTKLLNSTTDTSTFTGTGGVIATKFTLPSGTGFLKANGNVDNTNYATQGSLDSANSSIVSILDKTQNVSVSSTTTTFGGNVIATKFNLPAGNGFLKADGNVDNNNYATQGSLDSANSNIVGILGKTQNMSISSTSTTFNGLEATSFKKTGGTNTQYLLADGSVLQQSAVSGNSNYYLYNNDNSSQLNNIPLSGCVRYSNQSQGTSTIVFINSLSGDNIDISVFIRQITVLNDLYIQDRNNSANFIRYNITDNPSIIGGYISIPVSTISFGGNGSTGFGSETPIMVSFFTNNLEIDTRISNIETKTQYQSLTSGNTNFSGILTANTLKVLGGTSDGFLKGDGSVDSSLYIANPYGLINGIKKFALVNNLAFNGVRTTVSFTSGITNGSLNFVAGELAIGNVYNLSIVGNLTKVVGSTSSIALNFGGFTYTITLPITTIQNYTMEVKFLVRNLSATVGIIIVSYFYNVGVSPTAFTESNTSYSTTANTTGAFTFTGTYSSNNTGNNFEVYMCHMTRS